MKKIFNTGCAVAAALAVLFAAFLNSPAGAAQPKAKDLTTTFDLSHSEIFSPLKGGPLHYGTFFEKINQDSPVGVNEAPVSEASLKGVGTYVIAGPAKEFTDEEILALKKFVHDGGNILVLLHISQPVARLTESFGIIVSNFVISEKENLIKDESQDFSVRRFTPHPVTKGLKAVNVYGTWGLLADAGASVVASTSDGAWADLNRNRVFDEDEPVAEFGIIAVSEAGSGKFVVVADDAPFANKFITEADNAKLADNIMRWFRE